MELTPRLLTEVEFADHWRGYSKNEVDDFLERVSAGVAELQNRLREATDRAAKAERQLLERSADEEEIRRTLVLAQRAAATAIEEAKAEAEQLRNEAAERARADLGELERRKASLQAELAAMAARVEQQRTALRAELHRYLAELNEPAAVPPEAPEAADADEAKAEAAPASPQLHAPVPAPPQPVAPSASDDEVAHAREELVEALRLAGVEPMEDPPDAAAVFDDDADDGDAFLAELRRAVTDDAPLGPRDDD